MRPEDDYEYHFTVLCSSCREEHPKVISLNMTVGGRPNPKLMKGRARDCRVTRISELCLAMRQLQGGSCKYAYRLTFQKEHSASFIPLPSAKTTAPAPYTAENGRFAPLVALDCRGLEFTTFHFRGKWLAEGEDSSTPFELDFDDGFEEGRWDDYDEKAGAPVAVSECKSNIERI